MMTNNIYTFGGFLILVFLLGQCKTQEPSKDSNPKVNLSFGMNHQVYFLDSAAASDAITTDNSDQLFERITETEMEIQMKENRSCENKPQCIQEYKDYLKKDVENFNPREIQLVTEVFAEINEMISSVNPSLIDRNILLIKTKANHYGPSVYYTRENKIIIPKDVLSNFDKATFKQTMLHEFFHIFSRYNKETRDKLYNLIDFKPINGHIEIDPDLAGRKFLNPDGTTDYMISLNDKIAYPLIISKLKKFDPSKPNFFDYLDFHLYEIVPKMDGTFTLTNIIPFDQAPTFFEKITDNTDYIIHPDEIMADNFIYSIVYLTQGKKLKPFSSSGMDLIDEIGTILSSHQ